MGEAAGSQTPIWELDAQQARAASGVDPAMFGTGPDMLRAEDLSIPVRDGSTIAGRLLVPTDQPRAVLVYFHGGGWVMGELPGFESLGRKLAARTGAAVLLVDYRLAPEHPFPTPVQDAWDALRWAEEHKEQIAGAEVPMVVAGDSAGGNLTAVTVRWAREQGGPQITAQVLVYPVTDADFTRPSYLEPENQTLLPTPFMAWFWDQYVPAESARSHPDASPLRAKDLSGLPATFVVTGQHDVLRDEGQAYATALQDAGVAVDHHEIEGQMHGFFTMTGILAASDAVLEKVGDFLGGQLATTGATETAPTVRARA